MSGPRRPRANLDLSLKPDLVQDNVPAQVMDRVWIGSIHAAFNQEGMHERGITHVLNASGLPPTFPRSFTYFSVDLRDKEGANLLSAIGPANIFIEAGIEKGGLLVHCAGGRSRSAAFLVAYLMSTQNVSYEQAIASIRAVRPVVSVNKGFEQQLRAFSAAGHDVFRSHQMMLRLHLHQMYNLKMSAGVGGGGGGPDTKSPRHPYEGSGGSGCGGGGRRPSEGSTGDSEQGAALSPSSTPRSSDVVAPPRSPKGRWSRSPRSRGGGGVGIVPNPNSTHTALPHSGVAGGGGSNSSSVSEEGGGGGDGAAAGASAGAAGAGAGCSNGGNVPPNFLDMKMPRPANIRLSRPGFTSMKLILPLSSMEEIYCCRSCGSLLLTAGDIINNEIDVPEWSEADLSACYAAPTRVGSFSSVSTPTPKAAATTPGGHQPLPRYSPHSHSSATVAEGLRDGVMAAMAMGGVQAGYSGGGGGGGGGFRLQQVPLLRRRGMGGRGRESGGFGRDNSGSTNDSLEAAEGRHGDPQQAGQGAAEDGGSAASDSASVSPSISVSESGTPKHQDRAEGADISDRDHLASDRNFEVKVGHAIGTTCDGTTPCDRSKCGLRTDLLSEKQQPQQQQQQQQQQQGPLVIQVQEQGEEREVSSTSMDSAMSSAQGGGDGDGDGYEGGEEDDHNHADAQQQQVSLPPSTPPPLAGGDGGRSGRRSGGGGSGGVVQGLRIGGGVRVRLGSRLAEIDTSRPHEGRDMDMEWAMSRKPLMQGGEGDPGGRSPSSAGGDGGSGGISSSPTPVEGSPVQGAQRVVIRQAREDNGVAAMMDESDCEATEEDLSDNVGIDLDNVDGGQQDRGAGPGGGAAAGAVSHHHPTDSPRGLGEEGASRAFHSSSLYAYGKEHQLQLQDSEHGTEQGAQQEGGVTRGASYDEDEDSQMSFAGSTDGQPGGSRSGPASPLTTPLPIDGAPPPGKGGSGGGGGGGSGALNGAAGAGLSTQSADKRRWLARMSLIDTPSHARSSRLAEANEKMAVLHPHDGRWIYVGYLQWMGSIMSSSTGVIKCPNSACGVRLGSWSWEGEVKSGAGGAGAGAGAGANGHAFQSYKSRFGPPVISLDSRLVAPTKLMLSRVDSKASMASRENTPRALEGADHQRRGSGILEAKLAAVGSTAAPQG